MHKLWHKWKHAKTLKRNPEQCVDSKGKRLFHQYTNYPGENQNPVLHISGFKKPIKWSPSTVALYEIWRYQKSSDLCIRKLHFTRLIKDIAANQMTQFCFATSSITVLQVTVKAYLVGLLEDADMCTIHGKGIAIMPKDIQLTWRLYKDPCHCH